ncbi:hypothetical protein EYC84_005670 [Monilinia fructicola]|uniref:SH3 domain-containing protein n=1 Tax=Monilinia fructicola TaxID=38448 RepID=A0A5M9K5S3_MONFR|nr:hypothetical protein EYC84_005670 [Monilinia fructicola]
MKGRPHQHTRHARRVELSQQDEVAAPIEVRQPDPALQTIVSVVYVTAEPTFTGSIAGYSTVGQDDETTSSEVHKTTSSTKTTAARTTTSSSISESHASTSASSTLKTSASSSTELPSSIVATSSVGSSIALLAATSNTPTSSSATSSASSANASSTAAADSSSSGMSAGGKAGLAIGILLLFGAALVLLLFFFRKKKQAAKKVQRKASQRSARGAAGAAGAAGGAGGAEAAAAAAAAHRLSLRPVTQFQPFNEKQEMNQAPGPMGALLTPISTAHSYQSDQPNHEQNKNNPFGNHAEAIDTPNTNGPPIIEGFTAGGEVIATSAVTASAVAASASAHSTTSSSPAGTTQQGGPAPVPVKPLGLTRSASKAGNGLKQMDFTTKTQSAAGMAIVAAGGPPNTTVHRVQLDFAPSMDDELELKAGQLIRILHEYDDGWALCIRLDRSKQGVVPRTCLSTRPVKPRPQQQQTGPQGSPAMRPQQRPMSPGMKGPPRTPNKDGPPYPSSPMGNRPMIPNGPSPNGPPPNGPLPNGPLPNGPLRPVQPNGQGPPKSMPPNGPPRPMGPNGQGPPRGPGMMQGPPRPMQPNGQGPPRGPGMMQGPPRSMSPGNRPMTPQGQRPMVPPNHPNQQRPMTPQGPLAPRPLTPQGQRKQQRPVTPPNQQVTPPSQQVPSLNKQEASPIEGRARRDSDTDPISRQPSPAINVSAPTNDSSSSQSPPNVRSPVERKPVPGQAL